MVGVVPVVLVNAKMSEGGESRVWEFDAYLAGLIGVKRLLDVDTGEWEKVEKRSGFYG